MKSLDLAALKRVQDYGDRVARLLSPLSDDERCTVLAACLGAALCDRTWPEPPRMSNVMAAIEINAKARAKAWREQKASCEGQA